MRSRSSTGAVSSTIRVGGFSIRPWLGLHDSSASFGDAVGRYDSGRATMGEVVLKGGMAAFQVISVAIPAGKGLTALGRAGSHLLAASVVEAAEEDMLAVVAEAEENDPGVSIE